MSSPQALLWDAFRADPATPDLFEQDAHIVFLPTGAGAAGEKYVREFFQNGGYSHAKKLAVEERTIHRTVGESSAVDEVEITVKFVSGAGGWLLPGIEPHHLEDLTITFPMVICASFAEDRIASVRYVWDNASVLKMVRLIGSRQSWPIVAETQIDALRDPTRFRLNPYGNATSAAAGQRAQTGISKIFQATPPVSPSQNTTAQQQARKGHPALTSTVFSQYKNAPLESTPPLSPAQETLTQSAHQQQPHQQARKGHPALTSTVFSQYKNAPLETTTSQRPNAIPLSPSISDESIAVKSAAPAGATSPIIAAPTKKGHPALTSTLFNHLKTQKADDDDHNNRRDRVLSSGNDDSAYQAQTMAAPAPASKKGHPALTSTLFNHLKEQPASQLQSNHALRQRQEEEQQAPQEEEEERGAGWRADFVKRKGHPALTSTIFSKNPASAPQQAPARQYKKTSHNIFGAPAESKTVPTQEESQQEEEPEEEEIIVEAQTEEYVLEPSVIDAELERHHQQQQELKQDQEELQKEVEALDKLKLQQELQEQQEEQERIAEEQLNSAPVSPTPASVPATTAFSRKVHPNYRTSFTIGGPR